MEHIIFVSLALSDRTGSKIFAIKGKFPQGWQCADVANLVKLFYEIVAKHQGVEVEHATNVLNSRNLI